MTGKLVVVDSHSELPTLRSYGHWPEVCVGDVLEVGVELGSGGFGTVASCRVRGRTGKPVVVKIFTHGGGDNATVISGLHSVLTPPPGPGWEEHMVGVPYWVGEVRNDQGDVVHAWVSADLVADGFFALSDIVEDPRLSERLMTLPLLDRLHLAQYFADGCALLEAVQFLHADVNCENVFVDLDQLRAVHIDFDSGVARIRGDELPGTTGKADECMAPEIVNAQGVPDLTQVSEASERWAVGFILGYLIIGAQPLFFLRNTGLTTLRDYAAYHVWPDLPLGSSLASTANQRAYVGWLPEAAQLPTPTRDAFANLLGVGVDSPESRPAAWDWVVALGDGEAAAIEVLTVEPPGIVVGDGVVVSWHAPLATEVAIIGYGTYSQTGTVTVYPERSGPLELVARNIFGIDTALTPPITVYAVPALVEIRIGRPVTIRSPRRHVQLNQAHLHTRQVATAIRLPPGGISATGPRTQHLKPLGLLGGRLSWRNFLRLP